MAKIYNKKLQIIVFTLWFIILLENCLWPALAKYIFPGLEVEIS